MCKFGMRTALCRLVWRCIVQSTRRRPRDGTHRNILAVFCLPRLFLSTLALDGRPGLSDHQGMTTLRSGLRAVATTAAPALLMAALVWAFSLICGGPSITALIGLVGAVMIIIGAGQRTYHLLGAALILEGVENTRAVLATRGVLVSREKALEISAGLAEAQRVARGGN